MLLLVQLANYPILVFDIPCSGQGLQGFEITYAGPSRLSERVWVSREARHHLGAKKIFSPASDTWGRRGRSACPQPVPSRSLLPARNSGVSFRSTCARAKSQRRKTVCPLLQGCVPWSVVVVVLSSVEAPEEEDDILARTRMYCIWGWCQKALTTCWAASSALGLFSASAARPVKAKFSTALEARICMDKRRFMPWTVGQKHLPSRP